jgi:hypothetical protein
MKRLWRSETIFDRFLERLCRTLRVNCPKYKYKRDMSRDLKFHIKLRPITYYGEADRKAAKLFYYRCHE